MKEECSCLVVRRNALQQRQSVADPVRRQRCQCRRGEHRIDGNDLLQQRRHCAKRAPQPFGVWKRPKKWNQSIIEERKEHKNVSSAVRAAHPSACTCLLLRSEVMKALRGFLKKEALYLKNAYKGASSGTLSLFLLKTSKLCSLFAGSPSSSTNW